VSVLFIPLTLSVTSTAVSGSILSVGGIGMLVGSVLLSVWGGPKRRVYGAVGFLFLEGLAIAVGGIRPLVPLFFVAAFCYFFAVPLADGCTQAILQCKVAPSVQGRAFAFYNVAWTGMMPLAAVIVGPLADRVFEPLMAVDGPMTGTVLGRLIGVGEGRGMGLMFVLAGILLMLVTVGAYLYPHIRRVDVELPDALVEETPDTAVAR
jgi:hypothetical protein